MWRRWHPQLNANLSLAEVLDTMPRDPPSKIPWQIRLLENPESPFAFPGAIDLYRHDCLHALLCTSFYSECEAWTVGFTMGTDDSLKDYHVKIFKFWSRFYPGDYAFDKNDKSNFESGLKKGKSLIVRNLQDFPFKSYEHINANHLRKKLGINWMLNEEDYARWSSRWDEKWFMNEKNIVGQEPSRWKWTCH